MIGRPRGRGTSAAVLAVAASGLLLLSVTQPWAATVTQAAPGAPRWPDQVTGGGLVPWLAPATLVGGLAVVAGLAGLRWGRWLAVLALAGSVTGAVLGLLRAGAPAPGTLSTHPTAWAWVGLAAAAVALAAAAVVLAATLARRPGQVRTDPGPRRPGPARAGWEEDRDRSARDWRALSDGEDPGAP